MNVDNQLQPSHHGAAQSMDPGIMAMFKAMMQSKMGEMQQLYHHELQTRDEAWQKHEHCRDSSRA